MGHHAADHYLLYLIFLQDFFQCCVVKGVVLGLDYDGAFGGIELVADGAEGVLSGDHVMPPGFQNAGILWGVQLLCEDDRQVLP